MKTSPAHITGNNEGKVALLVIDVQQGLFEKSTPIYQADGLLENIDMLVDRAHRAEAPVIYVQHSGKKDLLRGTPKWQFHPHIHPLAEDWIVHKQAGNAFMGTNLDATLKSLDVTGVVVTGLVTHGCVKATCLGAMACGYQVTLVTDAHSNFSKQAPSIIAGLNQKMQEKGAILKPTSEITFGG